MPSSADFFDKHGKDEIQVCCVLARTDTAQNGGVFVGTARAGKGGGTRCGVGPHGEGWAPLPHGASAACLTLRIAGAGPPKGPLQP